MSGAIIIGLAVVLAIVAVLLARKTSASGADEPRDISGAYLESFPAKHPRYFPIIQQALSKSDARFLAGRVSKDPRKRAQAARRVSAMFFLAGLRKDFKKLTALARILAKSAPDTAQSAEMKRLTLEWKFNLLYAVVWLKLRTGAVPVAQLHALSDTIGSMATRLEIAMHAWQEASLQSNPELLG
jgi:hypothetical protein